jgi:hypothetical protein
MLDPDPDEMNADPQPWTSHHKSLHHTYLLGLLGEEFSIGRIATHKVHVIGYLSQDSVQTLVQSKFHFSSNLVYVESSVPDLGSGVFLIPGSGIREM